MSTAAVLFCALLLDAVMGEPRWLWDRVPHPAVLMGRLIGWCDAHYNSGKDRRAMGIAVVIALVILGGVLGSVLRLFGPVIAVIVVAILLAQRSLVDHVRAVADGLRQSLPQGRRAVAMIVSRDTADMPADSVARSAIESAAENLSDGVIAPAFWFLVGGLPGIVIYKLINTADSMIGYRTPRHAEFGWAAARLDDLLNWIPARLTAALIALPGGVLGQWSAIREDAALHRSPNAGWPEAAMARSIGVALAGPRAYDGKLQQFAWVNGTGARVIGPPAIDAAITRLWQTWGVMLILTVLLGLLSW
ncbi:cobalamin biosynthesis protein [Sulfitobacter sp. TSTF-M16]|uniref:Cobalamin biosynthesis protein CobD n=1 Tax=Sulfitobacter aestuariivivens TaxID=2766981 RepID=A0A927D8C9_9RHOB|nr:adenosylcobinamide-phosphate synthase CbiB [Sulfitobacter aestuariivivens]MBD3664636.1 cobalamin biosynthesis protein [Sulfitobacter aestuariivivens]